MSDESRDPEMAALIDAEGRVREPPQTREELERLVMESDARGLEGVVSIKITPHLLLELVRDRDEARRVSADAVKRRRVAETAAVALQERLDAAEDRAAALEPCSEPCSRVGRAGAPAARCAFAQKRTGDCPCACHPEPAAAPETCPECDCAELVRLGFAAAIDCPICRKEARDAEA